eukprot:scaffold3080_cov171-Skeletonema_dohrnii-CCMP3373.AAC.4
MIQYSGVVAQFIGSRPFLHGRKNLVVAKVNVNGRVVGRYDAATHGQDANDGRDHMHHQS